MINPDGVVDDYTGTVDMIGGNYSMISGDKWYTKNGQDGIWVEYIANFIDGKLVGFFQTRFEQKPALSLKGMETVNWQQLSKQLNG